MTDIECTCDRLAHPCDVHDAEDYPVEVRGPFPAPEPPYIPVGGSEEPARGLPRSPLPHCSGDVGCGGWDEDCERCAECECSACDPRGARRAFSAAR